VFILHKRFDFLTRIEHIATEGHLWEHQKLNGPRRQANKGRKKKRVFKTKKEIRWKIKTDLSMSCEAISMDLTGLPHTGWNWQQAGRVAKKQKGNKKKSRGKGENKEDQDRFSWQAR